MNEQMDKERASIKAREKEAFNSALAQKKVAERRLLMVSLS